MTSPKRSTLAGTHSGGFHADDVLALALLREFHDPDTRIVRSRDPDQLGECDLVFDVGGRFDPASGRFDHHQQSYAGALSSAGMVLDWLEQQQKIVPELAARLRAELVDYVDAVDNGKRTPDPGVPCFTSIVGAFVEDVGDGASVDERYLEAVRFAQRYVRGIRAGLERALAARETVVRAMATARASGTRVIELPDYMPWKATYFENGGIDHPTDFVLFPAEGRWRIVAIPPEPGSFATKVPLPESWAGLENDALDAAVGVRGARFCHKNRFLAVFDTRDAALEALRRWHLDRR